MSRASLYFREISFKGLDLNTFRCGLTYERFTSNLSASSQGHINVPAAFPSSVFASLAKCRCHRVGNSELIIRLEALDPKIRHQ